MEPWRIGAFGAAGVTIVAVLFVLLTSNSDDSEFIASAEEPTQVNGTTPNKADPLLLSAVPPAQQGENPTDTVMDDLQAPIITTAAAPSTTAQNTPTSQAGPRPSTQTGPAGPVRNRPSLSGAKFESIRNNDSLFNRFADLPESQITMSDPLTIHSPQIANSTYGDGINGAFRLACNYSHFNYDDPIVFPGQENKSHLHMFFGNTRTNAHTTTDTLTNSGGGSCGGFELNRSAYWTPAVMDGPNKIIVPDQIILYYKTKGAPETKALPKGMKMIAGNTRGSTFTASDKLQWACGKSGYHFGATNRIPTNCGSEPVNFSVKFPQCWDGVNLDSADHISHLVYINDNQSCPPDSHPVRLPQITFLVYFPGGMNTSNWYLSSDETNGFSGPPGGTLHADWFGGWNDKAVKLWTQGCMVQSRNCSYGQTGTNRQFGKLNNHQDYKGNNVLPMPS